MSEPADLPDAVDTDLPNLTGLRFDQLRDLDLTDAVATMLQQVEKPRVNLGSSGPPGRAD